MSFSVSSFGVFFIVAEAFEHALLWVAPTALRYVAFFPSGAPVRVPVPPGAFETLAAPAPAAGATYRDAPERALTLANLPGASRVKRDDTWIEIDGAKNEIVTYQRAYFGKNGVPSAQRIAMHIAPGHLELRARFYPLGFLPFAIAAPWALLTAVLPPWSPLLIFPLIFAAWRIPRLIHEQRTSAIAELEERLAIAAGGRS